ncbi:RDD family protein [Lishizhenia sp.]|uniref:RDD family protein n=1 Tax=Lishizhenia sp. TaxID=2497594 RepID=UPI00299D4722|nr:RDD family protein [Lishizhenia sp.]MDX1446373.1 RDD family protein [Lishizhenia sp.]
MGDKKTRQDIKVLLLKRRAAFLIDYILVYFLNHILFAFLFDPPTYHYEKEFWLVFVALFFCYGIFLDWILGQTPGKRILGIRIVDENGNTPSLVALLSRKISSAVLFLFLSKSSEVPFKDTFTKIITVKI